VHELAQVNVAVLRAPLSSPELQGFAFVFDGVARLADRSPGFVWRLKTQNGHATAVTRDGRDLMVNLSVWRDYASMHEFTYRSPHGRMVMRRSEWFLPTPQPSTALWRVPAGHRPTVEEAPGACGGSASALTLHPQATLSGRASRPRCRASTRSA
jgi:heme-degrading monooxygenase HmoA